MTRILRNGLVEGNIDSETETSIMEESGSRWQDPY